jgi:DNA-binding XRE family transcriptional regulator
MRINRPLRFEAILWDLDDDPDGNVQHCADHGVTKEEVEELPDLVARHHERLVALDQVSELVHELKAAREEKGLSLADMTRLTGMDRSALSKLETGQRLNPTIETLVRYADAVGKRLVVSLANE